MSIPPTFLQDLLARADVVEIVGRHVQLKKGGANFMGLCPFHSEKSPSFSVSPSKQFFHCFGCGKSGDAIAFLMEHSGMTFLEAVQELAQQLGLQVPDDHASPQDKARAAAQRQQRQSLSGLLEQAVNAYRQQLSASPHAIDYLKRRGLSGAIAQRFGLGYAPPGWRNLASVFPDYGEPLLVESGLVISSREPPATEEKRYDRFRDRIMFPIRNVKGECIGFGGRVLGDEKPKYLNSPETPIYHKGRELSCLFEARTALRESGYALVTEGYMDVVALAQHGLPHAVATLGTACTPEHLQQLLRFTDHVVFSFDGDAAGRRAARKALDAALALASDTRSFKFLFLPAEHDPDSFIRSYGRDDFARFVGDALPLSQFMVASAREDCDLGQAEGRAQMASKAAPMWQALPDGALKRQLLAELASLVQLDVGELGALWQARTGVSTSSGPSHSQNYQNNSYSRSFNERGRSISSSFQPPYPGRLAIAPAGRADQAVRLLLTHMDFMDGLSSEDLDLLCALPAPHGPLLAWLEGQFHQHGPQSWALLRERLQGQPGQALAQRLMEGPLGSTHGETRELQAELRDLLKRLLAEQLKQQLNTAIAAMKTDPQAAQTYRELTARLKSLG